jgi:hypothetical protein
MIYVTDGTNITMWFCSFKFSLCHFEMSSFILCPVLGLFLWF